VRTRAGASLLLALAGLVFAAPAAKAFRSVTPVVKFAASNGYRGTASGGGGQVFLGIEGHRVGGSYTTRGEATRRLLRANFGSFGRIEMSFVPSGHAVLRRARGPCGGRTKIRHGTWTGVLDLTAEGGFTTATVQSAPGRVLVDRINCLNEPPQDEPGPGAPGDGSNATALDAGGGGLTFSALKLDNRRRPFVYADRSHKVGRIWVSEYASLLAEPASFRFDPRRRSATVAPPAPFSGTARYRRRGGQASWRGDLSVALPNGAVALTGEGFHAALRRVSAIVFGKAAAPGN
jgi:hypothetical protein